MISVGETWVEMGISAVHVPERFKGALGIRSSGEDGRLTEAGNLQLARGFKSHRAHVNEKEEDVEPKGFVTLQEDGNTFLNRAELDEYRAQKVNAAWLEGFYA